MVLYPVARRHGERLALGFLASRVMEAAVITTGVVALLAVVTLRQAPPAAGPEALTATAAGLVAGRDWTFLLGPGLCAGLNAALLGSLLLRSGLVPRWIPLIGLVGAPLHLTAVLATILGVNSQMSVVSAVAVVPIVVWELSLALRLTFRGFRTPAPGPRHPVPVGPTPGQVGE